MSHVMNTYARLPVAFVRGQGVWLWDQSGRKYLDALAGIAVNTLGYAHPRFAKALNDCVASGVTHTSNLFEIPVQEAAADRIADITGLDEVFFCNSGCEANEAALKVARLYGHKRGVDRPEVIVFERAFHGRTLATLSATGSRKVQAGFEPLVSGFVRVPLDDLEAVRSIAEHNKNVVALLIEPIQGEGGINVPRMEYLRGLKEICDNNDWLFMTDEVQCGLGRTGQWFVYQQAGISPDVVTLAKGLGGGVPVGACVTGNRAKGVFSPGKHGSTFGGNPLACTAAVTVIDTMKDEKLLDNAAAVGRVIREGLSAGLSGTAGFVEARGLGMMIGVELDRPCADIITMALERGLVLNVTAESVIRLVPPLVMSEAEGAQLVSLLVPVVKEFLVRPAAAAPMAKTG
jgi:acetylornithine/N-succinyldiaminopimelate aminotransferase